MCVYFVCVCRLCALQESLWCTRKCRVFAPKVNRPEVFCQNMTVIHASQMERVRWVSLLDFFFFALCFSSLGCCCCCYCWCWIPFCEYRTRHVTKTVNVIWDMLPRENVKCSRWVWLVYVIRIHPQSACCQLLSYAILLHNIFVCTNRTQIKWAERMDVTCTFYS